MSSAYSVNSGAIANFILAVTVAEGGQLGSEMQALFDRGTYPGKHITCGTVMKHML